MHMQKLINCNWNCRPSSSRLSFFEPSKLFTNSASSILEGEVLDELLLDPSFFLWWRGPNNFILSLLGEIIPACRKNGILFPRQQNSRRTQLANFWMNPYCSTLHKQLYPIHDHFLLFHQKALPTVSTHTLYLLRRKISANQFYPSFFFLSLFSLFSPSLPHPPTQKIIMASPILPFITKVEKAKAWFLKPC